MYVVSKTPQASAKNDRKPKKLRTSPPVVLNSIDIIQKRCYILYR